MAEPRAQTLQQKFGFGDIDSKSPNHDEIMIWLDTNAEDLFKKITGVKDMEWPEKRVSNLTATAMELVKSPTWSSNAGYLLEWKNQLDEFKMPEPPEPDPLEITKTWEYAINPTKKFIIGFIDMMVIGSYSKLKLGNVDVRGKLEYKTVPKWEKDYREEAIYFEVKSQIPSLGDLIRQINMYREFTRGRFYVVSPDDRFAKQLKDQNIGFVKYPSGEIYDG